MRPPRLPRWPLLLLVAAVLLLAPRAQAQGGWFEVRLTNQRTSMQLVQYLVQNPSFVWSVGGLGSLDTRTYQVSGAVNTLARLIWDDSTTYTLEAGYDTRTGFEYGVRLGVVW